jgi:hypothetical protein
MLLLTVMLLPLTAFTQSLKPDELRQNIALIELELWQKTELLQQAREQVAHLESMVETCVAISDERMFQIEQLHTYTIYLEGSIDNMLDAIKVMDKQIRKQKRNTVIVAVIGGALLIITHVI